jgi:Protein-tyrosine phosphatase
MRVGDQVTPRAPAPTRCPLPVAGKNRGMEVILPDGTTVLARGRLGLVPPERPRDPDFGLYLDERWRHDPEVSWPFRMIDWPDFGLPADEADLFEAVVDLHRRASHGELVEIACYGGVGRTGTVLGCLTVLGGVPAPEAVEWVRRHYHPSAVETLPQEQLVGRFPKAPEGSNAG